jgi:hypothetical protein
MTYDMEGARVQVSVPNAPGEIGEVLRYYPVTEQYLVHITGTRCIVWMPTSDVEVIG